MTDVRPEERRRERRLLHLDSSADTAEHSVSRGLTALFTQGWRERHGSAGYRYRDVAADPVPPLGAAYAVLGRRAERHGTVPPAKVAALVANAAEAREWELTLPLIEEVRAADTLLLGVPMYNFSVPAALKAWLDRVSFPGAFTDPDSGRALLGGTRVVVAAARGGGYGPGTPRAAFDFQTPYLRAYFGNLGVAPERLHVVAAELTRVGDVPELAPHAALAARSLASARAAMTHLAAEEPSHEPG